MAVLVELLSKVKLKRNINDLSDEEKHLRKVQKLINEDYEEEESDEVFLNKQVVDLELVADFLELSDNYVQVVMKYGVVYVFNVDFETFKEIYQKLTTRLIISIKDETFVND